MTATRWRQVRAPILTAAGIGAVSFALRLRDPHQHASWGLCPFKAITGWDCPGCGGLRAVNDLSHARLAEAWHSNALFLALIPAAVVLWVLWLARSWTGSERTFPPGLVRYAGIGLAVVTFAFSVWRNTPSGSAYFVS